MNKIDEYTVRGLAFLEGDGAAKDYEQAFYWLNAAYKLGSDKAEEALLYMREMSLGTPFDGEASGICGASTINRNADSDSDSTQSAVNSIGCRPTNPNRCIACGMEALVPSTAFAGASFCSPDIGGCGTNSMIPIVENGLDRGVALQPYREKAVGRQGSVYSSLGALVHMVKYDDRVDDDLRVGIIGDIVDRIVECGAIGQLTGWIASRNLTLVPAPSSKRRKVQPVHLLAQLISENGYEFENALTKKSSIESKSRPRGTELNPDDIRCNIDMHGKAVILIDDTYGEGATLRACIRALREKGAREIYFLSLCKNIFGGMKGDSIDDDDIH